ncbi:MAG: FAD-dependent oxidoreductase [Ramlibacter sp.]
MTGVAVQITKDAAPVAIVGAGLAGVYAAWLLTQAEVDFELLESQDRLGGRILTESVGAQSPVDPSAFDLGPTWFWPAMQSRMPRLVRQLGLRVFEQPVEGATLVELSYTDHRRVVHGSAAGSMRLAGGMARLIEALAGHLDASRIRSGHHVHAMRLLATGEVALEVQDQSGVRHQRHFGQVISTLPPRLLADVVQLEPAPAPGVIASWQAVPTWMASHAKFIAVYKLPFWRKAGLSGQAQSQVGPLAEIHDASSPGGLAALFGFVGVPAGSRSKAGAQRVQAAALAQLQRLFGNDAASPILVLYKDWAADPKTATAADAFAPATHPAYGGQVMPGETWSRALVLAGSETAGQQAGYLEGALQSAEVAVQTVLAQRQEDTPRPPAHGQVVGPKQTEPHMP